MNGYNTVGLQYSTSFYLDGSVGQLHNGRFVGSPVLSLCKYPPTITVTISLQLPVCYTL